MNIGAFELDRVYNMNCLKGMPQIPDGSIDLVITSPPYDQLRTYNGYDFDFRKIANEIIRIIKQGGVIVWVVGDQTIEGSESGTSFRQALYFMENGMRLHDTMIYQKNGPAYPDQVRYYSVFEYMFIFSKGSPKTFNPIKDRANRWFGEKWSKIRSRRTTEGELKIQDWYADEGEKLGTRFNVWKYNVGYGYNYKQDYVKEHPATFPEQLAVDHAISWSNESELICDPFMGAATTAVACIRTNRHFIGFEIDPHYCEIANRRIRDEQAQLRLAL